MRIIAGELGGRRIRTPRGAAVRPTSDRVREALFSILGDVEGTEVLDLFCGTGALGIEALSRGAARATLVDTSVGVVARNVADLKLGDRARTVGADALAFLSGDSSSYDLVLCDPPYRLARRFAPDLDRLIPPRLRDGSRVIVETAVSQQLKLSLPLLDERSYGTTLLRIHGAPCDRDGR